MEKEINALIASFDISLKMAEIQMKSLLNVLEKTNPGLKKKYDFEFYRLWKEFESSLTPAQLNDLESYGFVFPSLD